jgi:hypothetical protein
MELRIVATPESVLHTFNDPLFIVIFSFLMLVKHFTAVYDIK